MTIRGTHSNGGQDTDAYVAARKRSTAWKCKVASASKLRRAHDHRCLRRLHLRRPQPGPDLRPSDNVWIHDNMMRRNGRQGVTVTDATERDRRAQRHRRHASCHVRLRAARQLDRREPLGAQQHGRSRSADVRRRPRRRRPEQRAHPRTTRSRATRWASTSTATPANAARTSGSAATRATRPKRARAARDAVRALRQRRRAQQRAADSRRSPHVDRGVVQLLQRHVGEQRPRPAPGR